MKRFSKTARRADQRTTSFARVMPADITKREKPGNGRPVLSVSERLWPAFYSGSIADLPAM